MLAALTENRTASVAGVIEADLVADSVRELAADRIRAGLGDWEGTATELLAELGKMVTDDVRRERSWPRQPNQLTTALKRAAPALRRIGVDIGLGRRQSGTGRRVVRVRSLHDGFPPTDLDLPY
jgi:hypothetical protein